MFRVKKRLLPENVFVSRSADDDHGRTVGLI